MKNITINSNINHFPNGWYAILHISEIPDNKPLGITRCGLPLVVWKSVNDIIVMVDRCPHRSAKLSLGRISNNQIRCPFHGFEFSPQGECTHAPEFNKGIPGLCVSKYKTQIALGMLWVMFSDVDIDINLTPLEELYNQFHQKYTFFKKTWHTNITRCIENQLDYTHLAEVHKTTIGRGFVIPQNIHFKETANTISLYNDDKSSSPMSTYIFPNSWILHISNKMKLVVYFVPVNEAETIIYLFTFRSFLNSPIIKPLVDFIMNISNRIVLAQDESVVRSQSCELSHIQNEMLMKHDKAIRLFRQMWQLK